MLIGLPKEIKNHEYRVGLTPASARELTSHGHQVMVQTGAGAAIGLTDAQYQAAGATLATTAAEVFAMHAGHSLISLAICLPCVPFLCCTGL